MFGNTVSNDGFQSTLPMRGGTYFVFTYGCYVTDFNPPSPCGEGLNAV